MEVSSKVVLTVILAAVNLMCCAPCATAAEDDTDVRIEKIEAALEQLQAELKELKAQRRIQQTVVTEKVDQQILLSESKEDKAPEASKWFERFTFSGDFRYRHESINELTERDINTAKNRHRIRARLGFSALINDQLDFYFRVATGSEIPTSTNQTLTDSFSNKAFLLDRAYIDWHPHRDEQGNIYAGKMENLFYRPDLTGLIWDSDVNPEGIAGRYYHHLDPAGKLIFNSGGFWVDNIFPNEDIFLWAVQGYYDHNFENDGFLRGGISYYDYGNIQGKGPLQRRITPDLTDAVTFYGNTSVDGVYSFDYNTIELFVHYGFRMNEYPFSIFYDYVKNPAAETHKSTGFLTGCRLNETSGKDTWQVRYNYRELAPDCVVGAFTDLDPGGGGTDLKGHNIAWDYMLTDNVMVSLLFFINEVQPDDQDNNRLQADINIRF